MLIGLDSLQRRNPRRENLYPALRPIEPSLTRAIFPPGPWRMYPADEL